MKKYVKSLGAILIAALLCIMLFACDSGTKYTFKNTSVVCNGLNWDAKTQLENSFDKMFKDSTIKVSNRKIVWEVDGEKEKLDVKRKDDQYILSGDFTEEIERAIAGMSGVGVYVTVDVIGTKNEGGFTISIRETVNGVLFGIGFHFTKG